MGCSQSRMEPGEELPQGSHHAATKKFWLRALRDKKDGYVRAEPMQREGSEGGDDSVNSKEKGVEKAVKPELPQVEEVTVNDGNVVCKEDNEKELRKITKKMDDNEEFPGSPSFRIYFQKTATLKWMEEANAAPAGEKDGKGMIDLHQKKPETSPSSTGESENKSSKKEKGSRFKGLAKGSSVVNNMLNR